MPIVSGDPYAIPKVIRAGRNNTNLQNPEVAAPVVLELKEKLSHPGTGRIYTTWFYTDKRGVVHPWGHRPPHQASAPFEPPAPDTGALRASVDFHGTRERTGAEITLFSTLDYAVYTEYGTSKMAPRPWFRPTMFKLRLGIAGPWIAGIEKRERAMARALGGRG